MLSIAGTGTSGTYYYNQPQNRVLIDAAFRKLGRNPADPAAITSEEIAAATEAANLILQSYPNRGINLWLRRTTMMPLIAYQPKYDLPLYTTSVREVLRRISVRATTNGTASATEGNADNAFDGDPATFCNAGVQGVIQYEWTYPVQITLVGVISQTTSDYQLNFGVNDIISGDPVTILSVPLQTYTAGKLYWFEIPTPVYNNFFGVGLINNGPDLSIQELYFNYQVQDIPLARISESDYMRFPNKSSNPSAPANFYVDLQIDPTIYLYPPPSPQYNNLFLSYQTQIQDFGTMQQNTQIPARFINAFTTELAYYLSMQYAPDKAQLLQADVERQYNLAHNTDRERVPLRVIGDYQQGGIS